MQCLLTFEIILILSKRCDLFEICEATKRIVGTQSVTRTSRRPGVYLTFYYFWGLVEIDEILFDVYSDLCMMEETL